MVGKKFGLYSFYDVLSPEQVYTRRLVINKRRMLMFTNHPAHAKPVFASTTLRLSAGQRTIVTRSLLAGTFRFYRGSAIVF
jgi:hypothetical protein